MSSDELDPVDAFLIQYLNDADAGAIRPLSEYLTMFPGDELAIAQKFLELELPAVATPVETDRIGPYRKIEEIGQGGQGTVWLAEDTRVRRRVALKLLSRPWASMTAIPRFRREAEVASRLAHPGICTVFDTDIRHEPAYIAMRYVEGETLGRKISTSKAQALSSAGSFVSLGVEMPSTNAEEDAPASTPPHSRGPEAIRPILLLAEKAARALHLAHEENIVHRDIKPGNIMVTPAGDPVILDFGLAKDVQLDHTTLTSSGSLFGTPAYMSPEQIAADRIPVDRRTDVYSLAVTLYECLTLSRPFEAPTRDALYQAILAKDAQDPRRRNPGITKDVSAILQVAMEKDRDRRYQTALDFAEDLRRARCGEPIRARPLSGIQRIGRWARRHPARATSVVLSLLLFVVVPLVLLHQRNEAREQSRRNLLLADILECARLITEESEDLYPLTPEVVPRMESWITAAEALIQRNSGTERTRIRALDLKGRVSDADLRTHLGRVDRLIPTVERRRTLMGRARRLARATLGDHAESWSDAIRDIEASERYAGLRLEPQLGLVPFRVDPKSGLWEFWHVLSGTVPAETEATDAIGPRPEWPILLVLVPEGTFRFGAGDPTTHSGRGVALDVEAFFIGKYEVTQAQWHRAMNANPAHYSPLHEELMNRASWLHPVETVSWRECWTFADRQDLVLPTEVQWEYAARAGTSTHFWWGAQPQPQPGDRPAENMGDESLSRSMGEEPPAGVGNDGEPVHAPIGRFAANPFGLYDVQGNVTEWCGSTFHERPEDLPDEPERETIPGRTDFRVAIRGSNWSTSRHGHAATWVRSETSPDARTNSLGLRVARPIRPPSGP